MNCGHVFYCCMFTLSFIPPFKFTMKSYFCIWQWSEVMSADAFSAFEEAGLNQEEVSPKELPEKIGLHSRVTYIHFFYYTLIYACRIQFLNKSTSPFCTWLIFLFVVPYLNDDALGHLVEDLAQCPLQCSFGCTILIPTADHLQF